MNSLSLILWLPALGAILITFLPAEQVRLVRALALVTASVVLLLSFHLLWKFDFHASAMQFTEHFVWSPTTGVSYALGVDGLALAMVLLTALLSWVALLASWTIKNDIKTYHAWFLVLESSIFGVFMALDWTFFFMFWEMTLIPLFFLIDLWGGAQRHLASLKFFLYTMGGSVFILVALLIIYIHSPARTFGMEAMRAAGSALSPYAQMLLLVAFVLGFGVKVPLFPFHGWLPLAHVEAPSPVSIMLSGILLKMGTYGMLRVTAMLPEGTSVSQWILVTVALINIVYGGLLAWRQTDLKAMIAYSSISHMGVVVLGMSTLNQNGILGASLQMIAHGVIAGASFLFVGLLYERTHTRELSACSGVIHAAPRLAACTSLALLAGIGMPGFLGFFAELHTLIGGFERWGYWVAIASLGVIISAAYALRTISTITGPVRSETMDIKDLYPGELLAGVTLVAVTIGLGIFPAAAISLVQTSATQFSALFANP